MFSFVVFAAARQSHDSNNSGRGTGRDARREVLKIGNKGYTRLSVNPDGLTKKISRSRKVCPRRFYEVPYDTDGNADRGFNPVTFQSWSIESHS